jgi:peptidoglycan/LPS O-acetylase OafA/YrhL
MIAALMITLSIFFSSHAFIFFYSPYFALGILLFNRKFNTLSRTAFWMTFVLISAWIMFSIGIPEGLSACFATLFILFVRIEKEIKINKVLIWLGTISYSLYLIHWELGRAAANFSRHVPVIGHMDVFRVASGILFSILSAWILYVCIEKPSLRYASKIIYKSKASKVSTKTIVHDV